MGSDYAMSRVKDALEKSDGNHLKAQRLLMQWVEKDQSLLVGLVGPHLQSIVTHAINHISQTPVKKPAPTGKKLSVKDEDTSEFGGALLDSLRGGEEMGTFGQATPRHITKPGKASKAHVDAINKLVSATKDKDKKKK